jgi:peptide deformylase
MTPCPDCGHQHAGVELAQICVGCPCLSVPAILGPVRRPARVQANADDYPDAAELHARDQLRGD